MPQFKNPSDCTTIIPIYAADNVNQEGILFILLKDDLEELTHHDGYPRSMFQSILRSQRLEP